MQDLSADGVLDHHLQVAVPGPRAAGDRPCLYPHGGLEHVYCQFISHGLYSRSQINQPLKIIRTGISMFPKGAEGAYVTRAVVNQAMSDHLVLALESLAALASGTAFDRTIVWTT